MIHAWVECVFMYSHKKSVYSVHKIDLLFWYFKIKEIIRLIQNTQDAGTYPVNVK